MAINVPAGGTNWDNLPSHVTPEQRAQYQNWVTLYANQYHVPPQVLMNMLTQESNWRPGITSNRGAQGIAQIMPGTAPEIAAGIGRPDFDPYNPEHGIQGGAYYLGRIYNQYYGSNPNGDWGHVAAGYNWGPNRTRLQNWGPETQEWLRNNNSETWNYYQALTRGLTPPLSGTQWGFPGDTPIGTTTPRDDSVPPPTGTNWGFPDANPIGGQDWVPGDTGQPIGPNTGVPGTAPPVPSELVPTTPPPPLHFNGAALEERSHNAGYDLPEGVAAFVGRTAPELAGGPESFGQGSFPWFTPGRITEDVGEILQHHALMPNNLMFNPTSQTWDVPNERRFPSNTGIWGAAQVASQLPDLGEGFNRDYLTHLGYGAEHNNNGLSNTYWGAPNVYGAPDSGVLGNWFGGNPGGNPGGGGNYPMPPYGTGTNWADMTTPQPIDYTSYYGALNNWQPNFNETFGLALGLDPGVGNIFGPGGVGHTGYTGGFNPPSGGGDPLGGDGMSGGDPGAEGTWTDGPGGGGGGGVGSTTPPPSWFTGTVGGFSYTNPGIGNPAPSPAPPGWTYNGTGNLVPIGGGINYNPPAPSPFLGPGVVRTGLEMF